VFQKKKKTLSRLEIRSSSSVDAASLSFLIDLLWKRDDDDDDDDDADDARARMRVQDNHRPFRRSRCL
jgi:hypothetical protein